MSKAKKISYGAVFSALGAAILCIGAFIDTVDISMACLAALIIYICVIEFGTAFSFIVYFVISAISLVLFSMNTAAWLFLVFAGWYPIFKRSVEKLHYVLSWAVKVSTFNVAMFSYWLVFTKLLKLPVEEGILLFVILLVANVVFIVYDLAMTRLVTYYIFRVRNRLGFKD